MSVCPKCGAPFTMIVVIEDQATRLAAIMGAQLGTVRARIQMAREPGITECQGHTIAWGCNPKG